MKRYIIFIIIILISSCDKLFNNVDSAPYFTSSTPTEEVTTTRVGNTHTVRGEAKDPDGDNIDYSTFKDGVQVNDTNEYTFTIDKKGMTKIEVIAYNALSDTLTRYFSAENQSVTAIDTAITVQEDENRVIQKNKLLYDADGDKTYLTVISTENVGARVNYIGDLQITALENYNGPAKINFSGTDNETTATGQISIDFTSVDDPPTASNVSLIPLEAVVRDTLFGGYDFSDIEGDLEGLTVINQYVNNELVNNGEMFLTNNLKGDDIVKIGVIPIDENGVAGEEVFSNEVVLKKLYVLAYGLYDDFDGNGAMQTFSGLPLAVAGEFSEWLWSFISNDEVIHLDDIVDYEVSSGANPGGYIAKMNGSIDKTNKLSLRSTSGFLTKFEDYKSWSADVLLMNIGEGDYGLVMDHHTSIPEQGGLSWYSQIGIKQNSSGDKYIFAQINNKNTEYQFWKTLEAELNTWYNLRMDITKLNETELEIQFYVNNVLLASEIPPDSEILLDPDRLGFVPGRAFDASGTVLIDNVKGVFRDRIQ